MFTLTIETDNAAFHEDEGSMAAEIVSIVADGLKALSEGATEGRLRDSNGNQVGTWSLKP